MLSHIIEIFAFFSSHGDTWPAAICNEDTLFQLSMSNRKIIIPNTWHYDICAATYFVWDMEHQSVLRAISDKAIISNRIQTEATNVRWSSLPILPAVRIWRRANKLAQIKHFRQKISKNHSTFQGMSKCYDVRENSKEFGESFFWVGR